MSGTVNISRDIWRDTAFKTEPFTEREAFIWIIMEASYKPRQKRVANVSVDLERGQLATSVRFMCEAWNWSKSRVDRFLKRLEKRDMIGTDSGTGVNVITVCKYDDYQNAPRNGGTPDSEKRDTSGTAPGQQRDKPNKGLIPDARIDDDDSAGAKSAFREQVLVAAGHDASGLTAGGKVIGNRAEWAEFEKARSDLHLSDEDTLAVVKETANQKRDGPAASLKYFIPSMRRFAGARDAPPVSAIPPDQARPRGTQHERSASKSKRRMDAFIAGARGTG